MAFLDQATFLGGNSGGSTPPPTLEEDVVAVPFAFDTPSPLILAQVTAGQILDRAVIFIEVPFDGVAPTLRLGTAADPGAVLETYENDTKVAGQYESDLLLRFGSTEFFQLTIDPSGSTAGSGILFYKLKL